MDRKEKLQKLRTMLQQVAPDQALESPSLILESTDASDQELDLVQRGMSGLMNEEEISADQEFALEAIVLKRNRPVINILGDSFTDPPSPWEHLSRPENKQSLTNAIPSIGRIELPGHARDRKSVV